MTTLHQTWTAIKTRAAAQITLLPVLWPREDHTLPDTPSPFVYFDLIVDPAGSPVSYGGGAGQNLYRYQSELNGYVFVPRAYTTEAEADLAEHVATAFRSFRDADISCFDATPIPVAQGSSLIPPGMSSGADQYECSVVSIKLFFDQIG